MFTRPSLVPNGWVVTCDSAAAGHGTDHRSLDAARECTWRAQAADLVANGKVTYDGDVVKFLSFDDYPLGGMFISLTDMWDLGDPMVYGDFLTVTD